MLLVDEKNVWDYITAKLPHLQGCKFGSAKMLDGGGDQSIGDGFLNYVYRVRFFSEEGESSVIVKQAREKSRLISINLPPQRIAVECSAMKIRKAIKATSVPEVLLFDHENYVMVMEDLNYMECLRYALSRGEIYPNLCCDVGELLAYNHFFTSERYLDSETFLSLQTGFINAQMRTLLANAVFVVGKLESPKSETEKQSRRRASQKRLSKAVSVLMSDKDFVAECIALREIYEKKNQCLIHGDLHTSNIFVDDKNAKFIDMEETIMGPIGFDLGYFVANLVSQLCAAPYKCGTRRVEFMSYIKDSIDGVFTVYFKTFEDLIERYGVKQGETGMDFREEGKVILSESIGFCATSLISRIASMVDFPEFDEIENQNLQEQSKILALLVGCRGLLNRGNYGSIEDFTEEIVNITYDFVCKR